MLCGPGKISAEQRTGQGLGNNGDNFPEGARQQQGKQGCTDGDGGSSSIGGEIFGHAPNGLGDDSHGSNFEPGQCSSGNVSADQVGAQCQKRP